MLKLYVARTAIIGVIIFFALVLSVYAGQVCTISEDTIVLRPGSRLDELSTLLNNNMWEEAERCCISCWVPAGTKVYIDSDKPNVIRVIEGKFLGCSGRILEQDLGNCKK